MQARKALVGAVAGFTALSLIAAHNPARAAKSNAEAAAEGCVVGAITFGTLVAAAGWFLAPFTAGASLTLVPSGKVLAGSMAAGCVTGAAQGAVANELDKDDQPQAQE